MKKTIFKVWYEIGDCNEKHVVKHIKAQSAEAALYYYNLNCLLYDYDGHAYVYLEEYTPPKIEVIEVYGNINKTI